EGTADRREREQDVERHLRPRRPDAHAPDPRWTAGPEDAESRQIDVTSEGIRHEIDGVSQPGECPDTVVLGEWSAPGLEERLRRDHQNVHARRSATGPRHGTVHATLRARSSVIVPPDPWLPLFRHRPAAVPSWS